MTASVDAMMPMLIASELSWLLRFPRIANGRFTASTVTLELVAN